jgi:L-rhamnose-H+ transport protein
MAWLTLSHWPSLYLSLTVSQMLLSFLFGIGWGIAVWPVALAGGFLPNVGYTVYLLMRNRTWNKLRTVYPDLFLSTLMGMLWIVAVAIYGLAAHQLGRLGDSAGWAIYQITMVLTASAAGVLSGEWKKASRRSIGVFTLGIAMLAVAITMAASSTR